LLPAAPAQRKARPGGTGEGGGSRPLHAARLQLLPDDAGLRRAGHRRALDGLPDPRGAGGAVAGGLPVGGGACPPAAAARPERGGRRPPAPGRPGGGQRGGGLACLKSTSLTASPSTPRSATSPPTPASAPSPSSSWRRWPWRHSSTLRCWRSSSTTA